jgi:SulP family sulfate permease
VEAQFNKAAVSKAVVIASAGFVVAIFTVIASASFATLIFSGPLSGFVLAGIRMALTTAIVVGFLVAITSSCRVAIAIPQDRIVPILALLATSVVTRTPGASVEEKGLAVISAVVLVTLITGLFLYALGRLQLGNLVRYIPYPVIGGFLAGSGWLLLLGGIRVMTGHAVNLASLPDLFGRNDLWHWAPGRSVRLAPVLGVAVGQKTAPDTRAAAAGHRVVLCGPVAERLFD